MFCLVTCKESRATAPSPQVDIRGLPHVVCTSSMSYYVDFSRDLSLKDVKDKTFADRPGGLSAAVNKYGVRAHYWLKYSLENLDSVAATAYLRVGYFGVIRVYEIQNGEVALRCGGLAIEKNTTVPAPELNTVTLVIPTHATIQYFVCLFSTPDYDTQFERVSISSKKSLLGAFYRRNYENRTFRFLQMLFFGFMLSQMVYVAFSRLIGIKRKEYLFYLFYLILVTTYFLIRYNRYVDIFWPLEYYPSIRVYLKSILLALPYLFYLKFARYFLDLGELDKKIFRRFIYLERFIVVYVLVDTTLRFVLHAPGDLDDILMIVISGIFIYCLILIFQLIGHKKVLVTLILTGSLVAALGGGIGILITFFQFDIGVLHTNLNALTSGQVGIFLETIIFTTSLSYKTRMMEIEKVEDQKKLIAQMRENAELKEKMEQTRIKIAQDLHDDIGSGLTRIAIMAEVAARQTETNLRYASGTAAGRGMEEGYSARKLVERIGANARDLVGSMSDVVWSVDPKNLTVGDLLKRLRSFAFEISEAKGIAIEFNIDDRIESLKVDPQVLRALLLISKEGLNNAIKHSGCKKVNITIQLNDKYIKLMIEDDGCGFDGAVSTLGHGLENMKMRTETVGGVFSLKSSSGIGTTIDAELPFSA